MNTRRGGDDDVGTAMAPHRARARRSCAAGCRRGRRLAAAVGTGLAARAAMPETATDAGADRAVSGARIRPASSRRQQAHTYFAAFDLTTAKRDDVVTLLRDLDRRRGAADRGRSRGAVRSATPDAPASDSGRGARPGAGAADDDIRLRRRAVHEGWQGPLRPGAQRPAALVDLPRFNGDQLVPARTGGDLSVQACADDPQVAFHAVRQLARLAYGVAEIRWAQTGFPVAPGQGRHAAQPDGLQGRHPHARRTSTRSSGSATRGRPGCAAAATWSCGASASRWNTGTAPRSASRSRPWAGTSSPARRSA